MFKCYNWEILFSIQHHLVVKSLSSISSRENCNAYGKFIQNHFSIHNALIYHVSPSRCARDGIACLRSVCLNQLTSAYRAVYMSRNISLLTALWMTSWLDLLFCRQESQTHIWTTTVPYCVLQEHLMWFIQLWICVTAVALMGLCVECLAHGYYSNI